MRCDRAQVAVSSRLDGEPLGVDSSALDAHLASCGQCSRWARDAALVTRLSRVGTSAVPDLSDTIAAQVVLPVRRVLRRRRWLRLALVITGLAQLVVGAPALLGDSVGMAMPAHAAHEAAAWNLGVGVAFLAAAALPRRATGLIPLLAVFLGILSVLSVHDLLVGAATADRVATHAAALVGLLLLIALDRAERALPPGWGLSVDRRHRAHDSTHGTGDAGDGGSLRTVA